MNCTYLVRLVVTDLANVTSWRDTRTFFIDGNMKVGNFTATFKDLELPLSGVPITVTRTYDSRNKCPGDFGYGWTLDVDSIRVDSTEQMGDAWHLFVYVPVLFEGSYFQMQDNGPHLLSIKMPDGQLLRFTPKLVMTDPRSSLLDEDGDDVGQRNVPISRDQQVKLIYRARSGTEGATLRARGYNTTAGIVDGDARFHLSEVTEGAFYLTTRENSDLDAPAMTDVTGWELTLRDGRVLLFDAQGKLEEMRDRVGNKVAFNRQGSGKIERITNTPSGKEIVFARDGANRIKGHRTPQATRCSIVTPQTVISMPSRARNDPAITSPPPASPTRAYPSARRHPRCARNSRGQELL